jgi:hypothetical protein
MEFYRAEEAIKGGERAVAEMLPTIQRLLR